MVCPGRQPFGECCGAWSGDRGLEASGWEWSQAMPQALGSSGCSGYIKWHIK